MARNLSIPALATLAILLIAPHLDACRYTVRDVAFVELDDSPYRVFVIGEKSQRPDLAETVRQIAAEKLQDANVILEFVDTSAIAGHPVSDYLAEIKQFPAVLAVGPEQQSLVLAEGLPADPTESAEQLEKLCAAFVDSPARREMFEKLAAVHSVILVVDGTEATTNAATLEMVGQTIPQVEQSLEYLPKPIKEPPHMIHLSAEEALAERVLLWSLGIDTNPTGASQVAVLFGRGRKLGPVIRFPEDPRRRLIRSLAVVGQDCECGLDRRWMQGAMVPHLWEGADEKRAIENLGFDPGNPLVKAEIDRILTRGPGSDGERQAEWDDSLKIAPALSYQEIALEDPDTEPVADSGPQNQKAVASAVPVAVTEESVKVEQPTAEGGSRAAAEAEIVERPEAARPEAEVPSPGVSGKWSTLLLVGSALAVVVIGLLILLRGGEAAA
ncbi:MAG: hypothetical protein VX431_01695 [Planctomycetota bacterium]|nr:hypothetical protein [Planctomycetota bacterium]